MQSERLRRKGARQELGSYVSQAISLRTRCPVRTNLSTPTTGFSSLVIAPLAICYRRWRPQGDCSTRPWASPRNDMFRGQLTLSKFVPDKFVDPHHGVLIPCDRSARHLLSQMASPRGLLDPSMGLPSKRYVSRPANAVQICSGQ